MSGRICVRKRGGKWYLVGTDGAIPRRGFTEHQEALAFGSLVNRALGYVKPKSTEQQEPSHDA